MSYNLSLWREYLDSNISVIPCKGKRPSQGIMDWSSFSYALPSEELIDSWENTLRPGTVTGIGVVLGPASNLCCIDFDEEDEELLNRLREALPHSPVVKIGKKGETRFFRLYEDKSTYRQQFSKKSIKNRLGTVSVEFFFSSAYTVIPPSIHPETMEPYFWKGSSLEGFDIEDLPILDPKSIAIAESVISGATKKEINANLPSLEHIGENENRFNKMRTYISSLIGKRTPIEDAINQLLKYDETNFSESYFLDKEKGHKTISKRLNALDYYSKNLIAFNRKHDRLIDLEMPREMVPHALLKAQDSEWATPIPFKSDDTKVDDFDANLIPETWRNWIVTASRVTGVNPESIFYPAITGLSSLIGNKVAITAKKHDKLWVESANIWSMYIAKSGRKKSQITSIALYPMKEIQKNLNEDFKKKGAELKRKERLNDLKIRALQKSLNKAVEAQEDDQFCNELMEEIEKLELETKAIVKKQLEVNVATPEKLIEILGDNQSGTLIHENELSSLLKMFHKKGYELLRKVLMDAWDGNKSFSYSTKMGGTITVKKLCASFFSNVQPSIFNQMIVDLFAGKNDDGFLQRSLLVFDDDREHEVTDETLNHSKFFGAYSVFHNANAFPVDEEALNVSLDSDAYPILMDFLKEVEKMVYSESLDALSSFWGKFRGNVVKIAYLLEFIEANNKTMAYPETISKKSLEAAIKILGYNEQYIRRAFNAVDSRQEVALKKLVELMSLGIIEEGSTIRDIYRSHSRLFTSQGDVMDTFKQLSEMNYCQLVKFRKSWKIAIHPDVRPSLADEVNVEDICES